VNATRGLSDAAVVRREDPDQTTGPLTLAAPFEDINIRGPLRFPMSRALIDKVRSESEPLGSTFMRTCTLYACLPIGQME
jgi:hypothetical protein